MLWLLCLVFFSLATEKQYVGSHFKTMQPIIQTVTVVRALSLCSALQVTDVASFRPGEAPSISHGHSLSSCGSKPSLGKAISGVGSDLVGNAVIGSCSGTGAKNKRKEAMLTRSPTARRTCPLEAWLSSRKGRDRLEELGD